MTLDRHAPGSSLDRHDLDPNAHAAAGFATSDAITAAVNAAVAGIPIAVGPRLIVPPGSLIAASGLSAWYTANGVTYMRFHVPVTKNYRYINFYVGTSSGNIQVGVSSLALNTPTDANFTRVMNSGIIACPTANAVARVDCGDTQLTAGDYALFLWCDNTTATFLHGLATGMTGTRMLFTANNAGGVGSAVTTVGTTTRWVSGMTLEAAT